MSEAAAFSDPVDPTDAEAVLTALVETVNQTVAFLVWAFPDHPNLPEPIEFVEAQEGDG
jgi:hypothetical protein